MSNELSTAQVAARFGVTAITVRLWCRQGHFKNAREMPTPRGAVWMIPESDLKSFKPPKTGRPSKPKAEAASPPRKRTKAERQLKTLS